MQAPIGTLVDSDSALEVHNRPIRPVSLHLRRKSCFPSLFFTCYGGNKVAYVSMLNPHANHQSLLGRWLQDEFA